MKKILFLVISGLIISGCSGSSGGTTTDTPPPVIPVVPVQPLVGTFNRLQSEFKIINLSNVEVSRLGVNETVKIRLIAKDEYNNLMTGLNIKFSRILSFSADLIPTEVSPGIYEFNFSSADQLSEEFSVTKDNVSVNLNKDLSVTYCAGASSGGASPFHVIAIQSAEQFYVICNATQLAAARNFTSRNYILGANIDLATYYIDANSDTIPDNQFKIGTDVTPYSGKFKGYNYSIRHFNYSDSSLNNVGLFGKIISGSTISDLTLDSPIIKGANKVGALAGSIETTNASPIIISGINILNATNSSTVGNQQGAFAGLVDGSTGTITISNNSISSTTNLNLSGSSRTQIGGAFGLLKGATVTQNFISSSINYTDKSNTISEIGCGAGRIESVNTFTNNSISCGMILNQGSYIGGISGRAINSYIADGISNTVTQDFTGTNPGDLTFTGGLFGSVATSSLLNLTGYISSNGIKDSFGGVSNFIMGSIATKIVLSGSVTGSSDGIGGLYSILDSTTLDRNISYNSLLVSGNHSVLGGIAALAQNGSSITRSSFNSTLEALNSTNMAGIVAETRDQFTLSNVSMKGAVNGLSSISGLVNTINDSINPASRIIISNSFSSGDLFANSFISGLVGMLKNGSAISNSFVTSLISTNVNTIPTSSVAIVNNKVDAASTVNSTYYLSSRSTTTTCAGLNCGSNFNVINTDTGNTFTDLSYYSNSSNPPMSAWNFTTIWNSFGALPTLIF